MEAEQHTTTEQNSDQTAAQDTQRYLVMAETIHDPRHNYTVLGKIDLDRSDFESDYAAAEEAVRRTTEKMTERAEEIVDDEFRVVEVKDSDHVVPFPET